MGTRVRITQNRLMGTVLSWKGRFGWIRSDKRINHEEAVKHGGRVYVHISDVEGRVELAEDARVSFFAYSDGDGLGAEQVQIEIQNLSHRTSEIAGVATVVKTRAQRSSPSGLGAQTGTAVPPKPSPAQPKQLFPFASGVAPKAWPCPKPSVKASPKVAPKAKAVATGWDDEASETRENREAPETPVAGTPMATVPEAEASEAPARRWRFQGASAPVNVAPEAARAVAPPSPKAKAPQAKPQAKAAPAGSMDGMALAAAAAANYTPPPGAIRWWKDLAGDCCPISLSPLEELSVDPFGLVGTAENTEAPSEGIWGKAGERMVCQEQQQSVHWFDGMFLASFLVSSGQLIDPVNRRALSRGECQSLDEYIAAHGFPAVHVTDAFDLAKAVRTTRSDGPAATRMAALEREAASMLRSLFDFRSVGNATSRVVPDVNAVSAPQSGAEVSEEQASEAPAASVHWPALEELPTESRPSAQQEERRIRTCTQRTVHNDGGLQVVDDTEFDVEFEEDPSEPTLAESASAPRRSRLARLPRARGDAAQITFSVTGRARAEPSSRPQRSQAQAQSEESGESDSPQDEPLEVETWIPEWATPDLHERQLAEIEIVEAMFPEEFQVLTPEVRTHLKECFSRGIVSRAPEPLRIQVSQHLDGPRGGCAAIVEFSMPPFYPLHNASIVLQEDERTGAAGAGTGWIREALSALQITLRTEVLPSLEGSEVIQKVLDWLNMHAPEILASSQREAADPKRKQEREAAEPAASTTKAERIEQARKERLSAKFTEKWDLCYAFVKHGSCKDKNCQWRHELPKKEGASTPDEKDEGKASKASSSGKSTAKAGGKKKK